MNIKAIEYVLDTFQENNIVEIFENGTNRVLKVDLNYWDCYFKDDSLIIRYYDDNTVIIIDIEAIKRIRSYKSTSNIGVTREEQIKVEV